MIYTLFSKNTELITGRIVEILTDTTGKRAVIILDIFHVLSTRHEIFGMPMLARRHEETTYVVIPSTVRICCSLPLITWPQTTCLYRV